MRRSSYFHARPWTRSTSVALTLVLVSVTTTLLLLADTTTARIATANANATTTCSAPAVASWQSKCTARTANNHDLLPLTDMEASEINIDDSNIVDTYQAARLNALKLSGAAGNAAMAGMRKKSTSWYATSLRHLVTYFCVQISDASDLERCVPASSADAARGIDSQCIALTGADSCSSKGLCERESNCKWDDPIPNATTRRALFSAENVTAATKWVEKGYPSSLAAFVAPGIVFAVLTALTCVGFVILRCVFNQCGGRNPREKGYTRCHILMPSIVFLVCTLAVFICSVVTVAQNTNISDGVTGVLNSLNVTLVNIDIFASNLLAPLATVETQVETASAAVATHVQGLEWIAADGATLRSMLHDFAVIYSTQGPFPTPTCNVSSTTCIACPDSVCGAPLQSFASHATTLAAQATTLVGGTVASLQQTFVNDSAALLGGIRTAHLEITDVAAMTHRSQALVDVVRSTFDAYSFSRGALVVSVFFFGLLSSVLGSFAIFKGVCTKKSAWVHMLHVSWLLGTLVCILGFVLSASLLAVGAVWYDSCHYLNILQADVSPFMPTQFAKIMNACFRDSSILAPLALEQPLGFACALDDATAALRTTDFAAFQTLAAAFGAVVADFGLRDFGFSSATSRELLTALNVAAVDAGKSNSKSFTQENIATPWSVYSDAATTFDCTNATAGSAGNTMTEDDALPLCYMTHKCAAGNGLTSYKDKCVRTFTSAYNYALAFRKISDMVDEMREELVGDTGKGFSSAWHYDVSITEFSDAYFTKLARVRTTTLDALLGADNGDVSRVLATVETLRCSQSCGWINISFNAIHNALCQDILGTTLAIALCVLFLCLFLIPMIVTGILLQKRLRGVTKGTYEQLERRLQALETKTKEEARAKAGGGGGSKESPSKKIELFKLKKNIDSA